MDLFSSVIEETSVAENLDEQLQELFTFVAELEPDKLKLAGKLREEVDFEAWDAAVKTFHSFAVVEGIENRWWTTVQAVTAAREDLEWNRAWDAAYDHAIALLLKPYVGKALSAEAYDLLVRPLTKAGWALKIR